MNRGPSVSFCRRFSQTAVGRGDEPRDYRPADPRFRRLALVAARKT
jgi:hypothetical protein